MKRKTLSCLLVLSFVFTMLLNNTAYATSAPPPTTFTLGGQTTTGCLKIDISSGDINVTRYNGTSFEQQYFSPSGAVLDINGTQYGIGSYFQDFTSYVPTLSILSSSSEVQNGNSVVTTWTGTGYSITQTVTLPSTTSQYVKLEWQIQNTGATALTNLHFLRGEDTYLANGDNGSGFWDASTNSIGVSKMVGDSLQRLFMQGITTPNSHTSKNYYDAMLDVANGGTLSNDIDANVSTDNGYAMEWQNTSLAAGASWTIKAMESFISAPVTATNTSTTSDGSTSALTFNITNSSSTGQTVTYGVTAPDGWTATPERIGDTLTGNAQATLRVNVTPPTNVTNGSYEIVLNVATVGGEAQAIGTIVVTLPEHLSIQANDTTNTLVGADNSMEYSTNGGVTWTGYDSSNPNVFAGGSTVLVRTKASSSVTIQYNEALAASGSAITATSGSSITVVSGSAISVVTGGAITADFSSHQLFNTTTPMEYSIDNGTTWISCTGDPITVADGTLLILRLKAGASVTVTFQPDPSNNSGGSGGGSSSTDSNKRTVEVTANGQSGSGAVASIEITRTETDNRNTDTVTLNKEKVQEALQKINPSESADNNVKIVIDNPKNNPADQIVVNIPADSVTQLAGSSSSLTIETEDVTIRVSSDTIKNLSSEEEDLYFRVVPIKDTAQREQAIDNVMHSAELQLYSEYKDIAVYGSPMTIETNYKDQSTTLSFSLKGVTLPTDPEQREKILANMSVYVKHSDNDVEIIPGKIIYDADGNPVSVEIEIKKFSSFTLISTVNTAPTAKKLSIKGTAKVNSSISVDYTYYDEDKDPEGTFLYQWYRSSSSSGKNKLLLPAATSRSYTLTTKDSGKYMICEVTPVATSGILTGETLSACFYVGNKAPVANKVTLTGKTNIGDTLKVSYTYSDAEKDPKAAPDVTWYRADSPKGKNSSIIPGASDTSYTLTKEDVGKYIICRLIPMAKTGTEKGKSVTVATSEQINQSNILTAHTKFGLIGSKTYANTLADLLSKEYPAQNISVKEENSYYRVSFDSTDLSSAKAICEAMKKDHYIINYYISEINK